MSIGHSAGQCDRAPARHDVQAVGEPGLARGRAGVVQT